MNVVIMACSGYPNKYSANNSKSEFIARGLKANGCRVAMSDSLYGSKGYSEAVFGTSSTGIDYQIIPRKGGVLALWHSIPYIWKYLKKRKVKDDDNHLLMSLRQYPGFFIMWIIALMLGYRRSVLFHEWHGCMKPSKIEKVEGYIRDYTFGYFVNTVFPISHFLLDKSKHFFCKKMILPVLASYDRKINSLECGEHFAYCCGAPYLLRNPFVLDAFSKLSKEISEVQLVLILSGNEAQLNEAKKMLSRYNLKERVIIKYQIPQDELYNIYDTAIALLIPMDPNNLQDKARFSQKIAEYVSTKRPIITSNVGEIPYYFQDKKSAIIVPFTAEGYYYGMRYLLDNPEVAATIGKSGYDIGVHNFDYIEVTRKMLPYLK